MSDVLTIQNGVVTKCDSLAIDVVVPDGIKEIGSFAFEMCENLKSLELPKSLEKIGNYAFLGAKNLEQIFIGENVVQIGIDVFENCFSLRNIESKSAVYSAENGVLYEKKTKKLFFAFSENAKIPAFIKSIDNGALSACKSVEVADGSALKTVPQYLRANNDVREALRAAVNKNKAKAAKIAQVKKVSADVMLKMLIDEAGISDAEIWTSESGKAQRLGLSLSSGKIEINLFNHRLSAWMKTLPNLLSLVSKNAPIEQIFVFAKENKIEIMGAEADRYAFIKKNSEDYIHNTYIKSIFIEPGSFCIAPKTFSSCFALQLASIPYGVETIGKHAFEYCRSLDNVIIPQSVVKIEESAFGNCESLSSLKFLGTKAQWISLSLGKNWNQGVPAAFVECRDGEIEL